MSSVDNYAVSLSIESPQSKKINIVARLRLIITEQLPVIRISGEKLGLMYVDGVQHRQTYFLFPNLASPAIKDSEIVGCLQRLIELKMRLTMQEKNKPAGSRRRRRRKNTANSLADSEVPGIVGVDDAGNELQGIDSDDRRNSRRIDSSKEVSKADKMLLAAVYGNETMGLIEFKNLRPSRRSLYMPDREECLLI